MEAENGATDGAVPGGDRASGVGQGLPWEDASVHRALLRVLLNRFPAAVVPFDVAGRVRYANPGARQHARRPPEQLSLGQLSEAWGDVLDASGAVVPVDEWPTSRALRGETVVRQEFHSRFLGSHLYPCLLTSVLAAMEMSAAPPDVCHGLYEHTGQPQDHHRRRRRGTLGGLIAAAAGANPAAIAASVVGGILVGGLVEIMLDERDKRLAAEAA